MPKPVSEWVSKYESAMRAVDWDEAASNWETLKSSFIANYTGAAGLNPVIARKYERKVRAASYKKPNVDDAIARYRAKMTGGR